MKQEFEIENYRFVKGNKILVYIKRDKIAIPITIPKEQYEEWLLISQRLITVIDLQDAANNRQQSDCIMSHDEYWMLPDAEVHADIYDYVTSHPITFRGAVYEKPLRSINGAFKEALARRN